MTKSNSSPISVLLIEDNPDDAALIQRDLLGDLALPCRLVRADRISSGLECLKNGEIDVVLLDLNLPDGSGISAFNAVHAHASGVPIILLTGCDDDELALEAVRNEAQDYIVKGAVSGALLRKSIRYAIERMKLLAELKQASLELMRLNGLLERQAATDPLTGVSNRHKFNEALTAELSRSKRFATPLSLIMFDIDHFKAINDTYGHLAGDEILVELTTLVMKTVRIHDTFARWGGEEFMILMANSSIGNALAFAERLRREIEAHPFRAVNHVSCSFGVAEFMYEDTEERFCRRVDDAMYSAKLNGRNVVMAAAEKRLLIS